MNRAVLVVAAGCAITGLSACAPDPVAPVVPPTTSDRHRVPTSYVLVGPAGTTAFAIPPARPGVAATGTHVHPGFGFVATEERSVGGRRYVHIQDGRWLPADDVTRARPSTFTGSRITPGTTPRLAWVITSEAHIRASPSARAPLVTTRPVHAPITLAGPCATNWCPLAVGWIRDSDLAIPTWAPRPGRVGPQERWLDIDLPSQTLVAYQGDQPVYATLISAGIGQRGSPLATPSGLFTIVSKHDLVRMDNLEHTDVIPYAYDVPLAQFFTDGKALHAALWHDRFGHPTSHGCVNLAPRDAEWLFSFTKPASSPGNPVVSATTPRPGTVLRIRGDRPAVALR